MPVTSDPCILLGSDAPDALRDLQILRSAPRRALRSRAAQALTGWARQIWQYPKQGVENPGPGLPAPVGEMDAPHDVTAHFTIRAYGDRVMVKIFTDGSVLLAQRQMSGPGAPSLRFLPWIFAFQGGKSAPVEVGCTNPDRHARQAVLTLRRPGHAVTRHHTNARLARIGSAPETERDAATDLFLDALAADLGRLAPLFDGACPVNPPHGDRIAFGCPRWRLPDAPYGGAWPWFLPHLDAAPAAIAALQDWTEAAAEWVLCQSDAVASVKLTIHARLPGEAGGDPLTRIDLRCQPPSGLLNRDDLEPEILGLDSPSLPGGAPTPTGLCRNGGNGGAGIELCGLASFHAQREAADLSAHRRLMLKMRFGPMPERVCAAIESGAPLGL